MSRRARIDWVELEAAFEANELAHRPLLDRETGDVVLAADGEPDRYVAIEPPEAREQYAWMAAFVETVADDAARRRLAAALAGKCPFREFKDVLLGFPALRQRWFEVEALRFREAIDRWLARHELEPETAPPWRARAA